MYFFLYFQMIGRTVTFYRFFYKARALIGGKNQNRCKNRNYHSFLFVTFINQVEPPGKKWQPHPKSGEIRHNGIEKTIVHTVEIKKEVLIGIFEVIEHNLWHEVRIFLTSL